MPAAVLRPPPGYEFVRANGRRVRLTADLSETTARFRAIVAAGTVLADVLPGPRGGWFPIRPSRWRPAAPHQESSKS